MTPTDVAKEINKLFTALSSVYMGKQQYEMNLTVMTSALTGKPAILIGEPGSFKTSLVEFLANFFDKPVVNLSVKEDIADTENNSATERLITRIHSIADTLKVNPEDLVHNLIDGVDVQYLEYGQTLEANIEIDLLKHPEGKALGSPTRVPLRVFIKQLTDHDEVTDVLGSVFDHPVLLKDKPPHVIKKGKMLGADVVILDEAFKGILVLTHIHRVLNEKVWDTSLGQVKYDPMFVVLATNPMNANFASNIPLTDFALFDRYAYSAHAIPPSGAESFAVIEKLKKLKSTLDKERTPVELLYTARSILPEVKAQVDSLNLAFMLIAHLSRCYFTPSSSNRRMDPGSPFELQHDCSVCLYGEGHKVPCSIGNTTRVRPLIAIDEGLRALAVIHGRLEGAPTDLEEVLMMVLPHRMMWNYPQFLAKEGDPYTATRSLLKIYASTMNNAASIDALREIQRLYITRDVDAALKLRQTYIDSLPLRAIIQEVLDMLEEVARKKGDRASLNKLVDQTNLEEVIARFATIGEAKTVRARGVPESRSASP